MCYCTLKTISSSLYKYFLCSVSGQTQTIPGPFCSSDKRTLHKRRSLRRQRRRGRQKVWPRIQITPSLTSISVSVLSDASLFFYVPSSLFVWRCVHAPHWGSHWDHPTSESQGSKKKQKRKLKETFKQRGGGGGTWQLVNEINRWFDLLPQN